MTTQASTPGGPAVPTTVVAPTGEAHRGMVFVLMIGIFLSVLDFFIVNVALPSIQHDLSAPAATVQFTIAGYALGYAGLLIIGGRLGDIYGRRKMFLVGILLFTLASAACGLASTAGFLIAGRVAQGLAAAIMAPQVLSIVSATLAGASRVRAFTAYGVTMGIAAVFGQLLGGLLIWADPFDLGWRAVFLINVPIGLVALLLVPRWVPESRATGRPSLDVVGMALVSLAMVAVVLPLIEGRQRGWPLWAWLCLVAAVPLFVGFAVYERALSRRGGSPLVDLSLFREKAFTAGLFTQLIFYFGQASFFLVFAIYVQDGRGLSPLAAGVLFIAIGGGYMVTSMTAQRFAIRLGRQVIALGAGLRVVAALLLVLTLAGTGTGSLWWMVPALILDGAGQGLAVAPLASTVLSRINPQYAGAASGVLSTGLWTGNAFGVAIIGVLFYGSLSTAGPDHPYQEAFSISMLYIAVVGLAVAALVQLLPRSPRGAR